MLISYRHLYGCYRQSSSPSYYNYDNKYDGHPNKGGHRLRELDKSTFTMFGA